MKYCIRKSFACFIYLLIMMGTSIGILMLNAGQAVKYILSALNLALFAYIVGSIYYKNGQDAMRVRDVNDIERKRIIETGEDRPLNIAEEYSPIKGFLMGVITCAPLILFMIIHTVLLLAGSTANGFGVASGILYSVVFVFFRISESAITMAGYYSVLICLPVISLITGIPYIMGAKSIERQNQMIKRNQEKIYGEDK